MTKRGCHTVNHNDAAILKLNISDLETYSIEKIIKIVSDLNIEWFFSYMDKKMSKRSNPQPP